MKSQIKPDKAFTETHQNVLASCLAQLPQEYHDLRELIKAWSALPLHIKAAIKALIQAHNTAAK